MSDPATQPAYVKVQQVADAVGVSIPTVHRWIEQEVIPVAIRKKRVIRLKLDDVLAALESRGNPS